MQLLADERERDQLAERAVAIARSSLPSRSIRSRIEATRALEKQLWMIRAQV
jgi:hypothetical protein